MANETYESINRDLNTVSRLLGSNVPVVAVSDWKGAIVSGIATHFGNIPHQRCLAHVERQAHRLLPKNSPFIATRVLRSIASDLFLIEGVHDPIVWKTTLLRWHKRYGEMLTEKTRSYGETKRKWWYTHTNVRRAWRLLTHESEPLFIFLTNHLVPKTNNALEGVNSNLKQKLGNHRGMSSARQAAFLSWYMTFTRVKTKEELTKLWVYQKSKFSRN